MKADSFDVNPYMAPGSLWHTKAPADQEFILARKFYNLIFTLVRLVDRHVVAISISLAHRVAARRGRRCSHR